MAGQNKIGFARDAAAFVVSELAPADRVSLTIFDDEVETLAPNAPASDRDRLLRLIAGVAPGGSTALHGGWAAGAKQTADNLVPGGLNRVLLLSDGLANVGESRPDAICDDVHARSGAGVSTTTLGLGNEYNEDLLEAMARSGDGNYYYVESPQQLAAIFRTELHGLTATAGTEVTLALELGAGVTVADVLNDLDRDPAGRCKLPNLVAGLPVLVVLRLEVPAGAAERHVCAVRLEWTAPGTGDRDSAAAGLVLPAVPSGSWDALAPDADVQERTVLLLIARAKKAAILAVERGDPVYARQLLAEARAMLTGLPQTAEVGAEIQALANLDALLERGDFAGSSKRAKHEAYSRRHSKLFIPPPDARA